jgi:hypothetical protein
LILNGLGNGREDEEKANQQQQQNCFWEGYNISRFPPLQLIEVDATDTEAKNDPLAAGDAGETAVTTNSGVTVEAE